MRQNCSLISILVGTLLGMAVSADIVATEPKSIRYAAPRKLCDLENTEIVESSGVAVSRRHADIFWTHNDSGDKTRLFALDRSGKNRGVFPAPECQNVDWEDMASFLLDDQPFLLVGDVGDNGRRRNDYTLYLFEEPQLDDKQVQLKCAIPFRYSDGSHDCEGVAVDQTGPDVYLVTKEIFNEAKIFRLPLVTHSPEEPLIAELVARCKIPLATGMDISADGHRAVIVTYFQAFEFVRQDDEDWPKAFSHAGRPLAVPDCKQCEAICFGADNQTLFITSEKLPTPLWEIAPDVK